MNLKFNPKIIKEIHNIKNNKDDKETLIIIYGIFQSVSLLSNENIK